MKSAEPFCWILSENFLLLQKKHFKIHSITRQVQIVAAFFVWVRKELSYDNGMLLTSNVNMALYNRNYTRMRSLQPIEQVEDDDSDSDSVDEFGNHRQPVKSLAQRQKELSDVTQKSEALHWQCFETDGTRRDNCFICLDPILVGDSIRTMRCNHFGHAKCLDSWLLQHWRCPKCRTNVKLNLQETAKYEHAVAPNAPTPRTPTQLLNRFNWFQAAHSASTAPAFTLRLSQSPTSLYPTNLVTSPVSATPTQVSMWTQTTPFTF